MELKIEKKLRELRDEVDSFMADCQSAMAKVREIHALLARHIENAPDINGSARKDLPLPHSLSPQQEEIFRLMGQDLSGQQIAAHMKLSIKTFNNYRDKLRKKLGKRNAWELAAYAREVYAKQKDTPPQ